MRNNPKLTLVGAGPGDPDLITVKGVKALQQADVVLYDALTNKQLLAYAPQASHVYVGKRLGKHSLKQTVINQMIVDYALNGNHVVRLKGGDPYVLARGTEEQAYAEIFGIEVEVVSGVTSAIAAPATQGISLTKRGVADSFTVVTGTKADRSLSEDIVNFAKTNTTLVVLMGMSKLHQIVDIYTKENKTDLPVAIIQSATTQNQKVAVGTIDNIELKVMQEKMSNPAVIVIGEVVKESLKWQHLFEEAEVEDHFFDRFLN